MTPNWNVLGHDRALDLLARAVHTERLSHAYLLSGPEGIGKRTLAMELAKAMLCLEKPADRPCQHCESCRRCDAGSHPDLRIVQLNDRQVQISRKEIGELQRDASLRPLIGSKKVYLLVGADLLSDVAANQLLKLLEEPPPAVALILTTAEIAAVLPTILSRVQHVRLQSATAIELAEQLVSATGLAEEQAARIAARAEGRIGWALRAAADPEVLEAQEAALDELAELLAASRLSRLMRSQELAGRWSGDRGGVIEILGLWAGQLRNGALSARGAAPMARDLNGNRLSDAMSRIPARDLIAGARAAQATCELLELNVHPRLALDALMLDLPHRPDE